MAGSPSFRLFSLYHHTVGPEGLNLFLKSRTILKHECIFIDEKTNVADHNDLKHLRPGWSRSHISEYEFYIFSNGSFGVLIKYPSDSVINLPKKLGSFCDLVKIAKKFSDKLTKNLAVWTGLRMKLSFLICYSLWSQAICMIKNHYSQFHIICF